MKNIILASKSPRRLEILRNHGVDPIVIPSNAEEVLPDGIGMKEAVMMLAEQKARSVYNDILAGRVLLSNGITNSCNAKIIGSDTIVYKDEIMGKPVDADDAFRMLSSIRNTVHFVATGVAIIEFHNTTGIADSAGKSKPELCVDNLGTGDNVFTKEAKCTVLCDVTEVHCKDYTDEQIWEYIKQEQPYDKAGSYAIQGPFGQYIDHIVGDYENVVGLPYHLIREIIKD